MQGHRVGIPQPGLITVPQQFDPWIAIPSARTLIRARSSWLDDDLRDGHQFDFFPAFAPHPQHRPVRGEIGLAANGFAFLDATILRLFAALGEGIRLLGFPLALTRDGLPPSFADASQAVRRHAPPKRITQCLGCQVERLRLQSQTGRHARRTRTPVVTP
jgi:hypothetical protein